MARFNKKTKIAALTAALVVGATGTAFAYWTMSGAGTGGATTGTTVDVVVNQTGAPITGLYPGGSAKALSGTFDNSNGGPVTVKAVTATVTGTGVGGCLTSWYAIGGADTLSTHVLPVGAGVGTWSGLTVSMTNDGAVNQDVCKLATITITYALAA
jgi:hypothetical protein